MFACPSCETPLQRLRSPAGIYWTCPQCDARAMTLAGLRRRIARDAVNTLWQQARDGAREGSRACPACRHVMRDVPAATAEGTQRVDVCTVCQFTFFDPREFEALPALAPPPAAPPETAMPMRARHQLAEAMLELDRNRRVDPSHDEAAPHHGWQYVVGLLGMPVEVEAAPIRRLPWATYVLSALVLAAALASFGDLSRWVADWGLVPADWGRRAGATLMTSFFLHGSVAHLLGNLYFLLILGDNVESHLGTHRFVGLLLFADLAGNALHILADPGSTVPCIGASGGISGVMAYYALQFPRARIALMLRVGMVPTFRWLRLPAWGLFASWIVLQLVGIVQQLAGHSRISVLAHLGGAGMGVVFWLIHRYARLDGALTPRWEAARTGA